MYKKDFISSETKMKMYLTDRCVRHVTHATIYATAQPINKTWRTPYARTFRLWVPITPALMLARTYAPLKKNPQPPTTMLYCMLPVMSARTVHIDASEEGVSARRVSATSPHNITHLHPAPCSSDSRCLATLPVLLAFAASSSSIISAGLTVM